MIELIGQLENQRQEFNNKANLARDYYKCNSKIKQKKRGNDVKKPHQVSNHKLASNFYRLLVMQKISYCFGNPVKLDVGDKGINEDIADILGNKFGNVCRELGKAASNDVESWIHYWVDEEGEFHYGVVDATNILPIWGGVLKDQLLGLIYVAYSVIDPEDGSVYDTFSYWNTEKCWVFRRPSGASLDDLEEHKRFKVFNTYTGITDTTNEFEHDYGEVPFIRCRNNSDNLSDLDGIKDLIDTYDEFISSLADDTADCEEILFVLTGYAGQDAGEFWEKVSTNRLIKLVDDPRHGKASLEKLALEPPIEAVAKNIDLLRKAIFEQGMGIDPMPESFGNTSGEALKYLNSLLVLKAANMQNEFEVSFSKLGKAICRYLGYELNRKDRVNTIWKPLMINNETELIANAKNSVGLISDESIIKHHPWVDDWEQEMNRKQQEEQSRSQQQDERAVQTYMQNMQRYQQNRQNQETDPEQQVQQAG